MRKILNFISAGVLMSALCVGFAACNDPEDPEPPTATFEGFEISDDGWIESPQWLVDEVESMADHALIRLYPHVYLLQCEGKEYIGIYDIASLSSNSFYHYAFYSLSGEFIDLGDEYPSDSMRALWLALRKALSENGVLVWEQPRENISALTRANQEMMEQLSM